MPYSRARVAQRFTQHLKTRNAPFAISTEIASKCDDGRSRNRTLVQAIPLVSPPSAWSIRRGVGWVGGLAASCLLLFSQNSRPLTVDPLSIEALSRQADLVVEGKVLNKTALRDASGRIYTRVELAIADVWKGAVSGSPLSIVHGGGVLGEERAVVSGQVEYPVGEEVVVFLARNPRGEAVTLGLFQGKFHIWQDAASRIRYASSPFHGLPEQASRLLRAQGPSALGPSRVPLEITELKKRVLEAQP